MSVQSPQSNGMPLKLPSYTPGMDLGLPQMWSSGIDTVNTAPYNPKPAHHDGEMLDLIGFRLSIPILTKREQIEANLGRMVALRGPIGNSKMTTIMGVMVDGSNSADR